MKEECVHPAYSELSWNGWNPGITRLKPDYPAKEENSSENKSRFKILLNTLCIYSRRRGR
jgi:hypothetical protein